MKTILLAVAFMMFAGTAFADGEQLIVLGTRWGETYEQIKDKKVEMIGFKGESLGYTYTWGVEHVQQEVYVIGFMDRSNCPDPTLLMYSPGCAKEVEVQTIPTGKTRVKEEK
jgi:hypothetical protein